MNDLASWNSLFRKQWFLIALIVCLLGGYLFAEPFKPLVDQKWVRYSITALVMFLMAWSMETRQVLQSIRRPKAPLLASFLNLVWMPLAAWPMTFLFSEDWSAGVIATAATPCTLAAASVWTRRAGGNDVTSMMTTVITNACCFVVTPIWIGLLSQRESAIPITEMILKLFLLVLFPMLLAQLTRIHAPTAKWTTENKTKLSMVAQVGILLMIVLGSVQMGLLMDEQPAEGFWLAIVLLSICMTALHFGTLFLGILLARWIGCEPSDQIAVGFSSSQKTLMVGLTASMEMGISVLPIVVFHTIQLIGDTPVADWFKRRKS